MGAGEGGGVGWGMSALSPCSIMALVIENTFTGIPTMAQLMFPGVSIFPYICFKNKVCRTRIPKLHPF